MEEAIDNVVTSLYVDGDSTAARLFADQRSDVAGWRSPASKGRLSWTAMA
jgi:hypothetical protein